MSESTDLRKAIVALVFSPEADKFRDEACRHVVAQPYADNRYVRLLDDLRRAVVASPPPPSVLDAPPAMEETT